MRAHPCLLPALFVSLFVSLVSHLVLGQWSATASMVRNTTPEKIVRLPEVKLVTKADIVEHDLDDSELADLESEGWVVIR